MITGSVTFLAYRTVRDALAGEFRSRLTGIAGTAASQISPEDLADAELFGEDGSGYGNIQVLLAELRATTGVLNASVIDTARNVVYDARASEAQRLPSPLAARAPLELDRALRGTLSVSSPIAAEDSAAGTAREPVQVALAPVLTDSQSVAGVVAIEAHVDYLPVLGDFQRSLALITTVILIAMTVLALLVVRTAWSSARLERRLSRAENLAAMGRLTATLAHEIKNPLAIIRGSAARLGKLEPEAQRMSEFVIEEVDRLTHTVGRYLSFARGEEAPGDAGDAGAALRATLDLLEGELRARSVTLAVNDADLAAAEVALDSESLKQVYLNLILNAVEAMPGGGSITIERAERGGHVQFSITDSGPGMSLEMLEKIRQPFYTTKAQGSGLGLFLTRRLIQSAGGTLEIESEPGRGTTCTVRFPRHRR